MDATPEIAAFGYHEVTDEPTTSGFQRSGALAYKIGRQVFAEHLEQLGTGPCHPSLVVDLDFERPGRHLLLTFDDGGKSALQVSEELSRRGWKGHFLIVTSLIGRRHFLDADGIRHIRRCGHVVGSHSHTHPDIMRDLPARRLLEEWRVSTEVLADLLGERCLVASVPGGDLSGAVEESAAAMGLRYLFTSEPRLAPRQVNGCWILGRFIPVAGTSAARVRRLARFDGWTGAMRVRQAKVAARRVLMPLYRLYVWRRTRGAVVGAE
jgi:peptidoglycan/xylan/chitin deacetylase (PgdA/CDA1 family)